MRGRYVRDKTQNRGKKKNDEIEKKKGGARVFLKKYKEKKKREIK